MREEQNGDRLFTIFMDESVKLMNFGSTSPSWPAPSNSAASHRESTVPTNCAKHSVQVRSGFGLPSSMILELQNAIVHYLTYMYLDHLALESSPLGTTCCHGC